jgi:hypothetical protein
LFKHESEEFADSADKTVDERLRLDEWRVYSDYDIFERRSGTKVGIKYIYVPQEAQRRGDERRYAPLARRSAELFLLFANWPTDSEIGLDSYDPAESLESERNQESALEWARTYGVLGLQFNPLYVSDLLGGNISEVSSHYLGIPESGWITGRRKNLARGGFPGETVEAFAREAWEAHLALRLYEAATAEGGPDEATIGALIPAHRKTGLLEHPKAQRFWALQVVEDAVHGKLRGRCYPVLYRDYLSHEQGWTFDSLLGAMWLQMMWLMTGKSRRCDWCGKVLALEDEEARSPGASRVGSTPGRKRRPPSHKRFCDNNGRCRSKWNYHLGKGKSSKDSRKRIRDNYIS